MRRILAFSIALAVSYAFLTTPAKAQISGGTWSFTTESVSLNLIGVSPFVERTTAGLDRIWFPGEAALPDPVMVVDCTESGTCTRQTLASSFGSDTTIVTLKNGTRKAFFVEMGPSGKKIRFATIIGNTLSHGTVTDLNVAGSTVPQTEIAWGVPDSVVLPDGRVRIYWVLSDQAAVNRGLYETLVSATSTDAMASTFIRDAGTRLTGGYVDSKILRAKDGDWVMMTSTGPGAGTQYLYMATSSDGLTWEVNPKSLSSSSESALDPTGYETGSDTWRIYYVSGAPGMVAGGTYTIKRAILSWKEVVATPTPTPTPTPPLGAPPLGAPPLGAPPLGAPPLGVAGAPPLGAPPLGVAGAPPLGAPPLGAPPLGVAGAPPPTVTATSPSIPAPVVAKPTTVAKKTTITCVKGKTIKKVTAVNPKCPSGYRKKS